MTEAMSVADVLERAAKRVARPHIQRRSRDMIRPSDLSHVPHDALERAESASLVIWGIAALGLLVIGALAWGGVL